MRIDSDVAEFVLEEGEFVGGVAGAELGDEIEDEGGFAGAEEAGDDGDGDGHAGQMGGIVVVGQL